MADDHSTGKERPVKIPNQRYIAVGKLYYYYTPRPDAPAGTTNCPLKVPWIQMKGRWLEQVGFSIGTSVRIRVKRGCLVLSVEED